MAKNRYYNHSSELPDRICDCVDTVYWVSRSDGYCFRVLFCPFCQRYGYDTDFICYGGLGASLNHGVCYRCYDSHHRSAYLRPALFAVHPSDLNDPE